MAAVSTPVAAPEVVAVEGDVVDAAAEEAETEQLAAIDTNRSRDQLAELRYRNAILEAKDELRDAAGTRLEILVGMFGVLVTVVVLVGTFLTWRIAPALVKAELADVRPLIEDAKKHAEESVEAMEEHTTTAERLSKELRDIHKVTLFGETLKPPQRQTLNDALAKAGSKPLPELSVVEFRTRIAGAMDDQDWSSARDLSVIMRRHSTADEDIAYALFAESIALRMLGRLDDQIVVLDDILRRFGQSSAYVLGQHVAWAHVNKGASLVNLDRPQDAIAVLTEFVDGVRDRADRRLYEQVGRAHFNRACAYAKLHNVDEAVSALNAMKAIGETVNCAKIRDDADFDPIRTDPAFVAFLTANGCLAAPETPAP